MRGLPRPWFIEEEVPFFTNENPSVRVTPNPAGNVHCPHCGKGFPITSNQFWSGLRHTCGQKLLLDGPYANKCWTKQTAA
jgi:hypothetical protein